MDSRTPGSTTWKTSPALGSQNRWAQKIRWAFGSQLETHHLWIWEKTSYAFTPDLAGLRFVKDLDGNGLLILIHSLQNKNSAKVKKRFQVHWHCGTKLLLLLGHCCGKPFRDLVWIQTPWNEADLLTTLMRIKRTRKTCSRIETDAWKVGSYKYKRAESIQNSQACSTVPFLHGNLNCLGGSTSTKDLPNRVAL